MENDIEKETSGDFKEFLIAVLKADRPADNGTVVANQADADAMVCVGVDVTPEHKYKLSLKFSYSTLFTC